MICSGSLVRSALVAIVLVAVVESGSAAQKLATCCKSVSSTPITEPITGFMPQQRSAKCVTAMIFQTKSGLYCSQFNAPWVGPKIREFMRLKAQLSPPTVSLLSIITSTASPSSSSAPLRSSAPLPSSALPSSALPSSSLPSSALPSSALPSSSLPSSALPSSSLPSSALPSISSTSETAADDTFTTGSSRTASSPPSTTLASTVI